MPAFRLLGRQCDLAGRGDTRQLRHGPTSTPLPSAALRPTVMAFWAPFVIGDCSSAISGIGSSNPGPSRPGVGSCRRPSSCAHAIRHTAVAHALHWRHRVRVATRAVPTRNARGRRLVTLDGGRSLPLAHVAAPEGSAEDSSAQAWTCSPLSSVHSTSDINHYWTQNGGGAWKQA